jgi:hypothetical protein
MILEFLRVGAVKKLSLISESVTEIRINKQSCRWGGGPDQHDIRAPTDRSHMTTFHNDIIGSIQVSPLPSAQLPHDTTHYAIRGWWSGIVQPLQ